MTFRLPNNVMSVSISDDYLEAEEQCESFKGQQAMRLVEENVEAQNYENSKKAKRKN